MNDSTFGSGWLPVLVILLVLFGMGGGGFGIGNNAAYATMADVNSAINNQSVQQSLNSALLSSNNNNYETAQLINQQTMAMMKWTSVAVILRHRCLRTGFRMRRRHCLQARQTTSSMHSHSTFCHSSALTRLQLLCEV